MGLQKKTYMGQKKMRILSPVDRFIEAESLIEAGATELYGGMFPGWFSKYPYFLSPNQRTFKEAQMDEVEFAKVVELCKARKVPIYLTINNMYFTDEQVPLIVRLAKEAESMGVDALIMGSLPLILNVREGGVRLPVHLSTMAVAVNHWTVSFFSEFGIKRFTLPRSLLLSEIKEIISHNPNFEYDAFILIGKCPNVEGFCSFLHTNPKRVWPCEQCYDLWTEGDAKDDAAKMIEVQKGWQGFPRGHGCGICAIPELIESGISGLKIVGRGGSMSFKVENVKLVKEAIKIHNEKSTKKETVRILKQLYKKRFGHDCSPYACYFPEIDE